MKFGKRQLILASLVLILGAAVYLNWQFSGTNKLPVDETGSSESSELGVAQLVNNAYVETATGANGEGEDVSVAASLSQARINRQESRDEAVEMLDKILSDSEADTETKKEAVEQAGAIAQNILKETNIENLLQAKGYNDSVAYISQDQCNVVLSGEIGESDTLIIQEIVMEQTGITADKIKIIGTK